MSSSGLTHHRGVDRSIASSRAPRLEANADRSSADVCGDFGRPSRQSEGGEALLLTASELNQVILPAMRGRTEPSVARWFVLWTRSHCERLVHDQLSSKGLAPFLPEIEVWSRRGVLRHVVRVPMFSGYLFLHAVLDKATHLEVRKARGLVSLLGSSTEGPAAVPDTEVTALQKVVQARIPTAPHPYLREGARVRITRGPLSDVEGVLVRTKPAKGMLVLSVNLLQRSVAVEVDCTIVAPL